MFARSRDEAISEQQLNFFCNPVKLQKTLELLKLIDCFSGRNKNSFSLDPLHALNINCQVRISLSNGLLYAYADLVVDRILEIPTTKNDSKNGKAAEQQTVLEDRPASID